MTGAAHRRTVRPRPRARDARGAAAVELALVLPVLVVLLVGTVTTGMSFVHVLGLTNAVREGARFGATANASVGSWSSNVASRVTGTQFDGLPGGTTVCVELLKVGGGGGVAATCPVNGGPVIPASAYPPVPAGVTTGQCVVRVVAAQPFTINVVMFHIPSGVITRRAVERYEGQSC